MGDLKEVLARAIADLPPLEQDADPAQDLRRGHDMLRRRRAKRAGAALTGAAVVAIALIPVFARSAAPVSPIAVQHHAPHHAGSGVRLVAYTGAQPPGYTVKEIPAGWVIQGSNPYVLVIAPANDPDKEWDSFLGKIEISSQQGATAGGQLVKVAGQPGYYQANSGDNTQMLVFRNPNGIWLETQAPAVLHWSMDQLIRFDAGITVLPGAKPSEG
jgi:hypothetical protein